MESDLHDLVWVQCSLVCSRLYLCMPPVSAAQRSEAQAEVMKYAAMFKSKLFMFVPQVSQTIVDHHSLSRAVPTTENLKCWTVRKKKNGARSYNKAMSSEMPSQDPHKARRDCVLTRRHALLHYCSSTQRLQDPPTPIHPQPHLPRTHNQQPSTSS